MRQCSRVSLRIFLSTPSARRATYAKVWNEWFRDISIHALLMQTGVKRVISIHALREEGDLRRQHPVPSHMRFLSTPSARRATVSVSSGSSRVSNFYPRPPRGGRRVSCQNADKPTIFLSTPSARRATLCRHSVPPVWSISIHALREEGDGGGFFVYRMVL